MSREVSKEIYSLHRYVDENGAPDRERIFSVAEDGSWRRHLNPDLMKIIENQPETVKNLTEEHIKKCETCRKKYLTKNPEQSDLPI